LIGRPDVLLLPVGGGPKAYTPQAAATTVRDLQPKLVIPTQYRTQAADPATCDLVALDEFLGLMAGTAVTRPGSTLTVAPGTLPSSGMQIAVLSYPF
ncbi:MAG: MBL fold metallo-hydrolase, partial [Cyanobacteria bacterium P01_A01_bin.105]